MGWSDKDRTLFLNLNQKYAAELKSEIEKNGGELEKNWIRK